MKKVDANEIVPYALPLLHDNNRVEWSVKGCNNWAADYPYTPCVHFMIAYTDNALLLHYRVSEDSVRVRYVVDNEAACTDSCVDFL